MFEIKKPLLSSRSSSEHNPVLSHKAREPADEPHFEKRPPMKRGEVSKGHPASGKQARDREKEIHVAILGVWKIYIKILQNLRNTDPQEHDKIPAVLKTLDEKTLASLNLDMVQALQAMKALPQVDQSTILEEEVSRCKVYMRTLRQLKTNPSEYSKVPAVIRSFGDEEVEHLEASHVQALRFMGVFPDGFISPFSEESQQAKKLDQALEEFCDEDPELRKLAKNPKTAQDLWKHPKIILFLQSHPELQAAMDQEFQKQIEIYLKTICAGTWGWSPLDKKPGAGPYKAHPYGTNEVSNVGTDRFEIFGELGWLLSGS